jgi:transposase
MKRDGRLPDHRTLEAIRLMAVERVRDGERPSSVVASYGFNRTTIYRWLSAAARPGVGLRALHARPATGRPRSLTPHQEQQVFRWVNGHDPRQYGLDFGLWARSVVAELIARKFAIRLGVTAVGELLAKLGLTPQKPLQRAYQRDPEAIEAWQRERYPAICQRRRENASARRSKVASMTNAGKVPRDPLAVWPEWHNGAGLPCRCEGRTRDRIGQSLPNPRGGSVA